MVETTCTSPVEHAASWWQFVAGWFGIRTRAWRGKEILARRRHVPGAPRCRECQRAVDGER